jgi:hypothetical protein
MKKTFLVVEGRAAASLLKKNLSKRGLKKIRLVEGQGRSSALSLARSILITHHTPVILLMNADTVNPDRLREQEDLLNMLLSNSAVHTPFKLLLATPDLETMPAKSLMNLLAQIDTFVESAHRTESVSTV